MFILKIGIWSLGGWGEEGIGNLQTVESYDPKTDTWRTEPSLVESRHWPVTWSNGEKLFVGGGHGSTLHSATIEALDPEIGEWILVDSLPNGSYVSDAVVHDGEVYFVGGNRADGDRSDKFYTADITPPMDLYYREVNASGTITLDKLSADLAGKTANSSGVNLPVGLITAIQHGDDIPGGHTPLERTDRNATHQWREMAPVSVARSANDGLEVSEEKIYFAGGYTSGNSATNIFESYDFSNDEWTTLTSMSVSRSGQSASFYNGKFYVFGGNDGSTSNVYASGEVYDLTTQTWTAVANMPYAKSSMTAITYNGLIYCMGGWTAGVSNTGHVLVYDPTEFLDSITRHAIAKTWVQTCDF